MEAADDPLPGRPPVLVGYGQVIVAPPDAAIAQGKSNAFFCVARKGGLQHVQLITQLGFHSRVAAVFGFHPDERGRGIVAPGIAPRPFPNRAEAFRNVFRQRNVCQFPDQAARFIPDLIFHGKAVVGHQVRKGPVHGTAEDVPAVG